MTCSGIVRSQGSSALSASARTRLTSAASAGSRAAVVPELLALLRDEERIVEVAPGRFLDFDVEAQMRRRIAEVLADAPPEPGPYSLYLGSVFFYGLLYTTIVLFFGLILFEDRDLA